MTTHDAGVTNSDEDRSVERLIAEAIDAARRGDTSEARLLAGAALRRDPETREAAATARHADSAPA